MANVKEIFGSLFIMFGILITIGATFCVMFFYFFFGPHWKQVLISLVVLLIGLGVLAVGIILFRLSKKSVEEETSRSDTSTTRLIGIFLTIFGALITPAGFIFNTFMILAMGIVILLIGIVLLVIGKKRFQKSN